MKIGFKTFDKNYHGEPSLNLGMAFINSSIVHCIGIVPEEANIYNAKDFDVLLFSLFWWEHFYDYVEFIYKSNIIPGEMKPILIVGGLQVLNPKPIAKYFDFACIGAGTEWIKKAIQLIQKKQTEEIKDLDGTYFLGKKEDTQFQFEKLPGEINSGQGAIKSLEIARGCRGMCNFCLVSWAHKYQELPKEKVIQEIEKNKNCTMSLFAPNRSAMTGYKEILQAIRKNNIKDISDDSGLDSINSTAPYYPDNIKFGMEGASYRLRKMVGKDFSDEYIVQEIEKMLINAREKRIVHAYLIQDLPTETRDDYELLLTFFQALNKIKLIENLTFLISTNSFMPQPFTPMQWCRINPEKDLRRLIEYVKGGTDDENFKFQLVFKNTSWGPPNRILSMIATRGDESAGDFIKRYIINKRKIKTLGSSTNQLLVIKKLVNQSDLGYDFFVGELPRSGRLPWDNIKTAYSKETLRDVWEKSNRKGD